MKKILCLIKATLICFSAGCNESSASDSSSVKTTQSHITEKSGLSESECKNIAKQEAIKWLKDEIDTSKYDVHSSQYKVETITTSTKGLTFDDKMEVCGTVYLYDKYGSLEDATEFEVKVNMSEYDNSKGYYTWGVWGKNTKLQ